MKIAKVNSKTNARNARVCAVIVTYNRLDLLKHALAAVQCQSRKPDTIVIVDNGSTDGTREWLATQATGTVEIVTQANLGSSGGFHAGILAAWETGADWIWCMDDDTIPDVDCLAQILVAEERYTQRGASPSAGWICSVVRWADGTLHRMNEPKLEGFLCWGTQVLQQASLPARWCSFVSIAISRQAIAQCGLPKKGMFIWYDDVEFTARITSAGFAGLVALKSQVEHRTKTNYAPDVEEIDTANLWRFRFAFRNEVIVLKTLFAGQPRKLVFQFIKMILRRIFLLLRAGKVQFLPMAVWQGFQGLLFSMEIDYPKTPHSSLRQADALQDGSIAGHPLTSSAAP